EVAAAKPMIDVLGAEPVRDAPQQIHLLERRVRRNEDAERLALSGERLDELGGRGLERLLPGDLGSLLVDLHHRASEAVLGIEAVTAEPVAVGDPRLVDRIVVPRHDPLHSSAQHVRVEIRADAVMSADERPRAHLPAASAVAKPLVVQRADRAKVDDVPGELVAYAALDVRADHDVLGAPDRAELLD